MAAMTALPHGRFEEILPDVFVVTGSFPMGPMMTIPRNMIVIRSGRDLTLVNAIRLSKQGEDELEALGTVSHVVRLGLYHTTDLPYHRERFSKATFWGPKPADARVEKLVDAGPSPRVRVFTFEGGNEPEAALIVEQPGGNLLVTCDSIQNWADTSGCSLVGGLVARAMGFVVPAKIGPIWLKKITDNRPTALRGDFDRLLAEDFSHLIAGHGVLLRGDAKAAIDRSCVRQRIRG